MRVQLPLVGSLIVLLCVAASGAESVLVQTPATTAVPTLQRLREICGPDGEYDACTRFVAYRLDAKCVTSSGAVTMNASVTFRPLIFLYNMRQLPHERLHIDDVEAFASRYAVAIASRTFASTDECEGEGLRLTAGFEAKMSEFARRSNLQRHPLLRAASR